MLNHGMAGVVGPDAASQAARDAPVVALRAGLAAVVLLRRLFCGVAPSATAAVTWPADWWACNNSGARHLFSSGSPSVWTPDGGTSAETVEDHVG